MDEVLYSPILVHFTQITIDKQYEEEQKETFEPGLPKTDVPNSNKGKNYTHTQKPVIPYYKKTYNPKNVRNLHILSNFLQKSLLLMNIDVGLDHLLCD